MAEPEVKQETEEDMVEFEPNVSGAWLNDEASLLFK